jgi:holin-like protein
MLLTEIFRVFVFLFIGNAVDAFHVLPVPGSVIGLILLYANLCWLGEIPKPLGQLADHLLGWLGMLFVPSGVGVLAYSGLIRAEFVPIAGGIMIGTLATILATAIIAKRISSPATEQAESSEGTSAHVAQHP